MKALTQYTFSCTNTMFNYLKDGDIDKLIIKLKEVESHAKETIEAKSGASLWFKFGKGDTLATDISDVENTLKYLNQNKVLLIEQFESIIGLEPDDELRVFYS